MILWLLAGTSCARFHPIPIDPLQTAAAFEERTLENLDLKEFLEIHLHHKIASWPLQKWDPETLTLVALYYHPDLDVARARVGVVEAGITTAAERPNPTVNWTPEFISNAGAGVLPWTLGLLLDIPVETFGKRGDRITHARQLSEKARLELAETAWKIRSRLRKTLIEYLLAERERDLSQVEEGLRADFLVLKEERYRAGLTPFQEIHSAQAELANVKQAAQAAEGLMEEKKVFLARSLGVPASAIEKKTISWPELDSPLTLEELSSLDIQKEGLLNRLDLRQALVDYAATESALQLEVAKQYPDLHLGPGYQWDQGDHRFILGLSISLPIFNQNQGPIAEAEATRKQTQAKFLALQAEAIGEFEGALTRYDSALAQWEIANQSLRELKKRQEDWMTPPTAGSIDPLSTLGMLIQQTVQTRACLESLQAAQIALGELEDTIQKPLGPNKAPYELQTTPERQTP